MVEKTQSQGIKEYRRCLVKRYLMVVKIGPCFRRIPLVDHELSLTQRNGCTRVRPIALLGGDSRSR